MRVKEPIVIVGAGLAGLSTGIHLGGNNCILFEKEERPGGLCRTERVKGFSFDYAGHFLHYGTSEAKHLVKRFLGANQVARERQAWIYSKKVFTRYPFQANTFGLPDPVIEECLSGLLEAQAQAKRGKRFSNFKEQVLKTFGQGIAKHFMLPYNAKLWRVPLDQLTCEWMGRFVPVPSLEEFLKGAVGNQETRFGYNARFWYPKKGGIEALAKAMAAKLPYLKCGYCLTKLSVKNKTIEFNGRLLAPFDQLVSTVPLVELVRSLEDAPSAIRTAGTKLRWNKLVVVNLGTSRPLVHDKHWVYVPEKEFVFYRVGFPGQAAPGLAPQGRGSVSAEISLSPSSRVDLKALEKRVEKDLGRMGLLTAKDRVLARASMVIPYAYVIYDKERRQSVDLILKYLKEHGIFSIGRYGAWEYSAMEDALLSGKRTAEKIFSRRG